MLLNAGSASLLSRESEREYVVPGCCCALCNSTLDCALSLCLSLGFEFEHLTIGFDVDHKTNVSNSGCQLTKNGKNADFTN